MAESSSPNITLKEELVTLDKPKRPNPFLPAIQVEFTFEEIVFITNNEVTLLYPSHPNQEYFKGVSDFISKCCLKEAFTRAPNQYKEYLSEFWYTVKVLPDAKIWVSTPTGEVKGGIESKSSLAMDTSPSHLLPLTPVVGEMHKEAQQAASGLTSLGDTSENKAHPQLNSGSNPSVLVDKTKSAEDGLKTAHTTSSINEESRADDILQNMNLEDLADILKDTRSAFFILDSPTDKPIIVSDVYLLQSQKKDLEQAKVIAKVALMKAKPLYPDINQLTELLEKLKTFDSLPGLLKTVTNTLNKFATLVENASGATTMGVPSVDKATASPAEEEKDADTNLKNELVDLLGIDIVTQYYNKKLLYERYHEKMKDKTNLQDHRL
uniref:Uncharacterized protein n=1 Tax=Tanacetum cinerariifolium TaxID=118510 RepID=A0A699GGZ4_TANCI|nr:hypothetical protein [Tanacetum cinerariifolium]